MQKGGPSRPRPPEGAFRAEIHARSDWRNIALLREDVFEQTNWRGDLTQNRWPGAKPDATSRLRSETKNR